LDSVNAEGDAGNIFFFYDGRQNGPGWISLKHAGFAPKKWEKKWGQAPFCKKEDILNLRT